MVWACGKPPRLESGQRLQGLLSVRPTHHPRTRRTAVQDYLSILGCSAPVGRKASLQVTQECFTVLRNSCSSRFGDEVHIG